MRQQLFAIIAISNRVGPRDIFLTVTCNQKRKAITNALIPVQ